jgi:hypothetical protein
VCGNEDDDRGELRFPSAAISRQNSIEQVLINLKAVVLISLARQRGLSRLRERT